MGDSGIEWTDKTWNPVVGCEAVSPGCDNCYAEREAGGRLRNVPVYAGLADGGRWTGEVRCLPDRLDQPRRWRAPQRVFVNSMSDLFHPDVPDEFILQVWAVMAACPQHQFQILTKRPQRAASFTRRVAWRWPDMDLARSQLRRERGEPTIPYLTEDDRFPEEPLTNVWLGTSVESQKQAWRCRHLLEANAAIRFVSAEPLLGPLDLTAYLDRLDWVIVGGESGPAARPMHPGWARTVRDDCQQAGVPFLFKQWGQWTPDRKRSYTHRPVRAIIAPDGSYAAEFTDPDGSWEMWRVGKHRAGRELDGRTWDEYPTDPRTLLINNPGLR